MLNLLLASNDFFTKYGILIIFAAVLAVLFIVNKANRNRHNQARLNLNESIKIGSKVKTYGGLYGTIVSMEETTDGKIVLLETGEGKKVSYQSIHVNAIFGIDDKKPVVVDAEGNVIFEDDKDVLDLDALEKEREMKKAEAEAKEEVKALEEKAEKPAVKKATTAKKPAAKKADK